MVVTVGFRRLFQLTGPVSGPGRGNFNGASFLRYISLQGMLQHRVISVINPWIWVDQNVPIGEFPTIEKKVACAGLFVNIFVTSRDRRGLEVWGSAIKLPPDDTHVR